jgi:hypothetical protein
MQAALLVPLRDPRMRRLLIVVSTLLFAGGFAVQTPAGAQSAAPRIGLAAFQKNHESIRESYVTELHKLVEFCRDRQLDDGVTEIGRFLVEPDTSSLRAVTLPRDVEPEIPGGLAEDERYWRTQLRFHRKEFARQLYLLSRRVLRSGFPGYAYELVRETAVHDPDHRAARELLGYVQFGKEWVTPYAREMLRNDNVWHDDFGWLPKSHVARYEKGERHVNGAWMSAEKEAEIRRDFPRGWEIRTDHYLIKTNYSLERGVELGRALEDFYSFFHETFAGFFNDPEQLQRIFNGTAPAVNKAAKPYHVNYYRTRDEYVQRLEKKFPAIQKTNGIYLTGDLTAHFYYDPAGNQEATLFHEATHQLFFESHPMDRPIGQTANFWIIEGIACYMESFRRSADEFSVGDPRYIRFAGARMNYIDQNYYVPLQEFAGMGMQPFQAAPMLAKNYTQAAGLAQFFMQYDNGRYRDALVSHLAQLYSANPRKRDGAQGLDELTDVEYEELDRQYGDFMRQIQQSVQAARSDTPATE